MFRYRYSREPVTMVQQIMISHYATGGPGQHLLPGLEEATSDDNHLCSSVYSHSQTMTDPRSNGVGFTSDFATLDQGSVAVV